MVSVEIRTRARAACVAAIAALEQLALTEGAPPSVKLAAIKELLDRGLGRPAAAPSESPGGVTGHVMVDDGYAH